MTATEKRAMFMSAAAALQAELARIRIELSKVSQLVCDLTGAGDSLLKDSVDEKSAGIKVKVSTITVDDTPVLPVTADAYDAAARAAFGRLKRACSICHKPGHRKDNCPDAAKAYKERKPKRKLSPERKAQLAKALEKARAARKAKR